MCRCEVLSDRRREWPRSPAFERRPLTSPVGFRSMLRRQGQAFVTHLGHIRHLEHITLAVATLPTGRAGWLHNSFDVKAAHERSTNAEHVRDLADRKHRGQIVIERRTAAQRQALLPANSFPSRPHRAARTTRPARRLHMERRHRTARLSVDLHATRLGSLGDGKLSSLATRFSARVVKIPLEDHRGGQISLAAIVSTLPVSVGASHYADGTA